MQAGASGPEFSQLYSVLVMGLMFGAVYFFMIRPQSKKKKLEDQMRSSLEIGDEITTIGGIMGRIVNLKEDSDFMVIETGADRVKMKVKRWAVQNCDSKEIVQEKKA